MSLTQLWELKKYTDDFATIIAFIIAATSIIVKLTPTLKDDNFLLPIVKWLSKYIALNRNTQDSLKRSKML